MFDPRVQQVDEALGALSGEAETQAALWDWACREMLHETQTGMHQISCLAGIAETVADAWRAPVDVIEPAQPYLPRNLLADARLSQVLDGLDGAVDAVVRAQFWRAHYAAMIAATLQGMRAVAGKYRIRLQAPAD